MNYKLGCTVSYDKAIKLIDVQTCQVLHTINLETPISCARYFFFYKVKLITNYFRFITAGKIFVGTLQGEILECDITTNKMKTITEAISGPISDIIRLEDNFTYEKAPITPVPTTPKHNFSNCSDMSMESESSCMTPGLLAKLRVRTPLAETQNSPLTEPIGMSTPAGTRRAFFPSP